jgi:hypothetical protein
MQLSSVRVVAGEMFQTTVKAIVSAAGRVWTVRGCDNLNGNAERNIARGDSTLRTHWQGDGITAPEGPINFEEYNKQISLE